MIEKIIKEMAELTGEDYLWKKTSLLIAIETWANAQHPNIYAGLSRGSESIYIIFLDDEKDEKLETRISLHPNGRGYHENYVVNNYYEYWEAVQLVIAQYLNQQKNKEE